MKCPSNKKKRVRCRWYVPTREEWRLWILEYIIAYGPKVVYEVLRGEGLGPWRIRIKQTEEGTWGKRLREFTKDRN